MTVDFEAIDFVRAKNKAKKYDRQKQLDDLAISYNKETDPDKKKEYKEKWFNLIKKYGSKI